MNDYIEREELARLATNAARGTPAIDLLVSVLQTNSPPLVYMSEVRADELCGTYRTRQRHVAARHIATLSLDEFVDAICGRANTVHVCTLSNEEWNVVVALDEDCAKLLAVTAVAKRGGDPGSD